MSEILTFTALGVDVLRIIISVLHYESPSSLRRLSLVSKFCKELVEPVLYRAVELSDGDKKFAYTQRMIQMILDPNDGRSRHVRDLWVSEFSGTSEKFSVSDLEKIIAGLFRLQGFRWDAIMLIPERVISKLEQQWPNSKLIVSNHDHNMTDTRLLSSPLLYTLVFGIRNRMRDHEIQEQNSKLPELRDILLESPQLRRLDIKTRYSWMQPIYQTEQIERRLLNLPLQPSDRLPPLTELSFSGPDTYELDLEHCQLWSQCMDWSQLYTLNLGISCPQHLFSEIGPQLVGLKELTMGIRTGDRRYEHWKFGPMTCDHLMLVLNFIESVPDLYELNLTDLDASPDIVPLWIVDCQRSLQSLSYHASMHRSEDLREGLRAWDAAQLPYLRQRCPDLAHLLLDFPLVDGGWPADYADNISRFNHLRCLKIFVELNSDASDFAAEYSQEIWGSVPTPPFNETLGREVATNLFKSFFANDPYTLLTDLEVCFTREEVYDRNQSADIKFPIRIRRLERGDALSPLEGGFTIDCAGEWLGGW